MSLSVQSRYVVRFFVADLLIGSPLQNRWSMFCHEILEYSMDDEFGRERQ